VKPVLPLLGDRTLGELASHPSLVQGWLRGLGGLSDGYARLLLTTLSGVLSAAVDDGLIQRNPCQARAVQPPKLASRKIEPWSAEQVAAVRAAMKSDRWQVVVDLGAGLGMRQGEIFGLAKGNIEFLRQGGPVLHVRRQVRIVGSRMVFSAPKGGKERTIPLPQTVAEALAAHLARYPARAVTLPWDEPGGKPVTAELVVTTPIGKAVNRNSFNTFQWKPALAEAGIPASRENGCHALRHYFASALLLAGCDIKSVSEYLGHHSAVFTLQTYAHVMPAAHDRMRAAIDAAYGQDHGPATAQGGP
jgi:integrase